MERDEYWAVLQKINDAGHADVASFAEALEEFGLLKLALIAERARHRMRYLDHLDALAGNPATVEKDIHKAIENSLWVLGTRYAPMASNTTLKRVVEEYLGKTYVGERAAKRPDLRESTREWVVVVVRTKGYVARTRVLGGSPCT